MAVILNTGESDGQEHGKHNGQLGGCGESQLREPYQDQLLDPIVPLIYPC